MKLLRALLAAFLPALLLAAPTLAQTGTRPSAPEPPTPQLLRRSEPVATLQSRARLVLIDVVVTDRNHRPIPHLKQSDFLLTEDKAAQTINAFDEHAALTAAGAARFPTLPPLGPGIFTDFTATPTNSAVNILLLDILNTPLTDQVYVHQQIQQYIKKARPGSNTAIFVLTSQLHILQGFTTDPEVLRAALKKDYGGTSPLLGDPVGTGDSIDLGAGLQSLQTTVQAYQQQLRTQYTLDGFNSLARYLANIPGRKNLIWFSGAFPIDVLPDGDAADPFANEFINEDEYRETTNLLAQSQVAVYPIDGRGLQVDPAYSATARHAPPRNNNFGTQNAIEHETMSRIAEDTGGEAFYNTNDLASAVGKAIDHGSNFYTLAYTPANPNWKGDFRNIKVQLTGNLAAQGYTLAYRRGYYAGDPHSPYSAFAAPGQQNATTLSGKPNLNHVSTTMLRAMAHGLPQPQQILYKVRVLPIAATPGEPLLTPGLNNLTNAPGFAKTTGPYTPYAIDFAADAHDFQFAQAAGTSDGKFLDELEFVALAYDRDGKVLVVNSHIVQTGLTRAQLDACLRTGLPFHLELDVPAKGAVTIRTGIHELATDRVAAVEISIAAVKNLPALASSPAPPPNPAPPAGAK